MRHKLSSPPGVGCRAGRAWPRCAALKREGLGGREKERGDCGGGGRAEVLSSGHGSALNGRLKKTARRFYGIEAANARSASREGVWEANRRAVSCRVAGFSKRARPDVWDEDFIF
jgi:hypothetical protein